MPVNLSQFKVNKAQGLLRYWIRVVAIAMYAGFQKNEENYHTYMLITIQGVSKKGNPTLKYSSAFII